MLETPDEHSHLAYEARMSQYTCSVLQWDNETQHAEGKNVMLKGHYHVKTMLTYNR